MKFCTKCGKELVDDAVICIGCGCAVEANETSAPKTTGLKTAIKVFMVLGTVFMGFYLIPLAWCIPMTISYFNKVNSGKPVSTAFKVCSLLFVNTIAGILMLCDN